MATIEVDYRRSTAHSLGLYPTPTGKTGHEEPETSRVRWFALEGAIEPSGLGNPGSSTLLNASWDNRPKAKGRLNDLLRVMRMATSVTADLLP
jgi:hypothetical protein